MKSSYATFCGTVVLTAALLASGCKREDPDRTPFDNRVFMTDVTPVRLLVERETSELEGLLAARTAKPVDEPVALTYSADESLVSPLTTLIIKVLHARHPKRNPFLRPFWVLSFYLR